jgi:hypothetical protein
MRNASDVPLASGAPTDDSAKVAFDGPRTIGEDPVSSRQDEFGNEKCHGSALGLLARNFADLLQVSCFKIVCSMTLH